MNKTREALIVQKVIRAINAIPHSVAYKRYGGPTQAGQPDVTGAIAGFRIELEGKIPGKKPTMLQEISIKRWKEKGCISGWFQSVNEAMEIIHLELISIKRFTNGSLEKKLQEAIEFIANAESVKKKS